MKTEFCMTITMPDGIELETEIEVEYKAYHQPATMYRANGDPGDPAESEMDIEDITVLGSYPTNETLIGTYHHEVIETRLNAAYLDKIVDECWDDFTNNQRRWCDANE